MRTLEPTEPRRASWVLPVAAAAMTLAVVLWKVIQGGDEPPPPVIESPEADGSATAFAEKPAAPPRCAAPEGEPFVIGEPGSTPKPAPKPTPTPDEGADPGEEVEDPLAPFAVEVARGAVFDGGFAVGARRDAEGGAIAIVATIGPDGRGGRTVRLGRSRGDLDPPVVAGAGDAVLAALLEPNAGGRAVRLAKVKGAEVTWGAEFAEGRDESLALDLAVSGGRAILAWDDVPRGSDNSVVMLAPVEVATLRPGSGARPVSPPGVEADSPRVIARPGGFWLAYVARAPEPPKKDEPKKGDAKKSAKPRHAEIDDDVPSGEQPLYGWIEVVPLDESGTPAGAARAVTPKDGHVLAYDLERGEDDAALIAWHDADTPSGSSGGRLSSAIVRLGGSIDKRVLAEESLGTGVPDLLQGWLVVATASGTTRVAAMNPKGELVDALEPEPSLGSGVPTAATKDAMLIARPAGKAMRLSVVRCAPRP